MPGPITHLIWGYVLTRSLTDKPGYLLLGMVAGILPDVGAVVPGIVHHGWLHTPVFVIFASLTLWGANYQDRLTFWIPAVALTAHLVMDSISGEIIWLRPLSTVSLGLFPLQFTAGVAAARVFLLVPPAYWVWDRWKRTGEGPMAALRWAEMFLPRPVTWTGSSMFGIMTVFVLADRFLAIASG